MKLSTYLYQRMEQELKDMRILSDDTFQKRIDTIIDAYIGGELSPYWSEILDEWYEDWKREYER